MGWVEVLAEDGEAYYWNQETGETTWDKPADVVEATSSECVQDATGQELVGPADDEGDEAGSAEAGQPLGPSSSSSSSSSATSYADASGALLVGPDDDSGEFEESRAYDAGGAAASGGGSSRSGDATSQQPDAPATAAEARAPPPQTPQELFEEMLVEKGIEPFAKWDKELPKLAFDRRFLAVDKDDRRDVFTKWVKSSKARKAAKKRSKEKKNKSKKRCEPGGDAGASAGKRAKR